MIAISGETPRFSARFRNLNVVFSGLQVIESLVQRIGSARQTLASLRAKKDVTAVRSGLTALIEQTNGLDADARSAFQATLSVVAGEM